MLHDCTACDVAPIYCPDKDDWVAQRTLPSPVTLQRVHTELDALLRGDFIIPFKLTNEGADDVSEV